MASEADLTRLDAILKDRELRDSIQDAVNKATPFAEQIDQELTLSGRKGIFPVQFGVNEGIFARGEKESFGDSQVNKPELAEVQAKYLYALFDITGPAMSATRDNEGAFEDALALSLQNTIDGMKLEMGFKVLGDGTGIRSRVKSVTDTDTIVTNDPFGIPRLGTTYKSSRQVRNIIRTDMALDVLDASDQTAHGDNLVVSGITQNSSSNDTTIDFGSTDSTLTDAADDDWVVRNDDYNNDIEGWLAAVDDSGTYLNISRSGNEGWQGVLVDASDGDSSAVPLDPDHLRDTVDEIMESSGEEPEFLVCNFKQRRNLYNLYAPQIRYAPMVLPSGLREETLTFDDMPVIVERFFPPEHIGVANTDFWFHAIDKDTEWIQGLNGTVLHFDGSKDQFFAVLRTYRNMACLYPAAQGMIYGLEE